jgi:hypothetical protein
VCDTGEPTSVALLGGSLSIRGWNHADESYIAQVHKWLEVTFVEGCREEAEARAQAAGPGGGSAERARRLLLQHAPGSNSGGGGGSGSGGGGSSSNGIGTAVGGGSGSGVGGSGGSGGGMSARRRRLTSREMYARDPRPDASQDLHVATHAGYAATGHMCASSGAVDDDGLYSVVPLSAPHPAKVRGEIHTFQRGKKSPLAG